MMIKLWTKGWAIVALAAATLTAAEKDSDYYFPGYSNPNAGANSMYWKDSVNVLQDLDQFDSLYIKYHRCVWGKFGMRYGSGQDYDEQGADEDDNDDDTGCGSWGGEYFWYMGRTQCFKAQVAYSLYGVLKGKTASTSDGSVCHKKTYINSFFTTYGVESFTGPLGLGADYSSVQCDSEGGGDEGGDNNNNYDDYGADDDYLDDGFVYYNYADYTSTGIGCSAQGTFVQDQYQGAFCKGRNYQTTLDTLDSLNTAMESEECTQIYDYNNAGGSGDNRALEEEDYNFEDMEAVKLLSFSKSCSLRQYPDDCPDPYGLKKKYANRIEHAFAYKTGSKRNIASSVLRGLSYLALAGSVVFLGGAALLHRNAAARLERRQRRREKRAARRSRAKMGKIAPTRSRSQSSSTDKPRHKNRRSRSKDGKLSPSSKHRRSRSKDREVDQSTLDRVASAVSHAMSDGEVSPSTKKTKKSLFADFVSKNNKDKPDNDKPDTTTANTMN